METDIKGDKRGLGIEKRRKKSFHAQEALVLLAQLSHNLLAWFKEWFLGGTEAQKLGVERLVRDVMAMPGEVRVGTKGRNVRLKLPRLHPWAKAVAAGIESTIYSSWMAYYLAQKLGDKLPGEARRRAEMLTGCGLLGKLH
jgi:hypothetical protein